MDLAKDLVTLLTSGGIGTIFNISFNSNKIKTAIFVVKLQ